MVVIAFVIPPELRKAALEENGYIENATLFGYILCIYFLVREGGSEWVKSRWCLVVIPLLLLAREADLHAKYTEYSIFGTKYFFSGSGSALSLIIGAVIVIFVLWIFASTTIKYYREFFRKLRDLDPCALFIGIAMLFAIAAKTIDGTARKLDSYQLILDEHGEIIALLVEETLELGISLALCLAALNYFRGTSTDHSFAVLRSQ